MFFVLAGDVAAQDEPERPWANVADLSIVITAGNSSVTTLAASDKFTYKRSRSEITVEGSALRSRTRSRDLINVGGQVQVNESTRTTAEEYGLSTQYRYSFFAALFAYAGLGWTRNEFAGIDARYVGAVGLGYRILDSERQSLLAEVGGDWTNEDPVTGGARNFAGAQVGLTYVRQLTENATLDVDLAIMENLKDTDDVRADLVGALTTSVSEVFAIKLTYTIRFDNKPVEISVASEESGVPDALFVFDETDTRLAASLVIKM